MIHSVVLDGQGKLFYEKQQFLACNLVYLFFSCFIISNLLFSNAAKRCELIAYCEQVDILIGFSMSKLFQFTSFSELGGRISSGHVQEQ